MKYHAKRNLKAFLCTAVLVAGTVLWVSSAHTRSRNALEFEREQVLYIKQDKKKWKP